MHVAWVLKTLLLIACIMPAMMAGTRHSVAKCKGSAWAATHSTSGLGPAAACFVSARAAASSRAGFRTLSYKSRLWHASTARTMPRYVNAPFT